MARRDFGKLVIVRELHPVVLLVIVMVGLVVLGFVAAIPFLLPS